MTRPRPTTPWLTSTAAFAILLLLAAPAWATPLHELVAQGKVRVEVTSVNGYTSADVRIVNLTNEYLEIDPTGSAIIPTSTVNGKYSQRLALTTPGNYGPNDKMTVGPGGTWSGRLRTCCMDLGKPTPTQAKVYTKVEPVPDTVQAAMEYWHQHPELTQDSVNRVIWGMTQLDDLIEGFNNGTCPRRDINQPIDPRTEYPQDAIEHQREIERVIREAEELLAREARRLEWTPVLPEEDGSSLSAPPVQTPTPGEGEGPAAGATDATPDFLAKAMEKHIKAAAADRKPVVVLVISEKESDDWAAVHKASMQFMDGLLLDEKVAELLKKCVRLKLEIARVPADVARANQLNGRRAPQLMLYDYEGKLRYRVQEHTPAEAAARLSRLINVVEHMADKEK
ncbi:MAG: hypothetical protein AB7K09_02100 [Planctomycetota bacterium]